MKYSLRIYIASLFLALVGSAVFANDQQWDYQSIWLDEHLKLSPEDMLNAKPPQGISIQSIQYQKAPFKLSKKTC